MENYEIEPVMDGQLSLETYRHEEIQFLLNEIAKYEKSMGLALNLMGVKYNELDEKLKWNTKDYETDPDCFYANTKMQESHNDRMPAFSFHQKTQNPLRKADRTLKSVLEFLGSYLQDLSSYAHYSKTGLPAQTQEDYHNNLGVGYQRITQKADFDALIEKSKELEHNINIPGLWNQKNISDKTYLLVETGENKIANLTDEQKVANLQSLLELLQNNKILQGSLDYTISNLDLNDQDVMGKMKSDYIYYRTKKQTEGRHYEHVHYFHDGVKENIQACYDGETTFLDAVAQFFGETALQLIMQSQMLPDNAQQSLFLGDGGVTKNSES